MAFIIRYEFVDGTVTEIEVMDRALGAEIRLLERRESNNQKREKRRHISLDTLIERGLQFQGGDDPFAHLLNESSHNELCAALGQLPDHEQMLLHMRFTEGMKLREIAAVQGVEVPAISKHLYRIYDKLCKLLR